MAFLDLHEGIAELFQEGGAILDSRRSANESRRWFMQNRVGRHLYTPPMAPLACEVSCLLCRQVMANTRALTAHVWRAHKRARPRAVTCCVCRESFTHRATFLEHYASKHQEANLAASRINLRIARAARS